MRPQTPTAQGCPACNVTRLGYFVVQIGTQEFFDEGRGFGHGRQQAQPRLSGDPLDLALPVLHQR